MRESLAGWRSMLNTDQSSPVRRTVRGILGSVAQSWHREWKIEGRGLSCDLATGEDTSGKANVAVEHDPRHWRLGLLPSLALPYRLRSARRFDRLSKSCLQYIRRVICVLFPWIGFSNCTEEFNEFKRFWAQCEALYYVQRWLECHFGSAPHLRNFQPTAYAYASKRPRQISAQGDT